MSLQKLRELTEAQTEEDYIVVPADVLAAACQEAGEKPTRGSLAEEVNNRVTIAKRRVAMGIGHTENPAMHVHRVHHLGKMLGAKDSGTTTPAAPAVKS